ncbi:unnamed protein product [Rhizoctonia solani]|uniref:deuterolysin n=1 Tax=Rhizoctonia solani TaxID=456999 RepID=A0A8H2XGK9_9AGAM|nr:unnamed protein product [Rhizoctonia solani]
MLVIAAFILSTGLIVSADRSLSLKVVAPQEITDVDNLHVAATVSNTGSETLRLLRDPRSPLSTYPTETFGVVNSKGAPGESVTVEHDLAGVYNLTSTGPGAYTIDAANLFRVVEADSSLTDIYADIDSTEIKIQGKLASFKNAAVPSSAPSLDKRASYSGCSSTQQSQIASAIGSAQNYASNSYSHLTSNPSGSTRYTGWFGTFATSRYNLVFSSLSASLNPNPLELSCLTYCTVS